MGVPHKKWSYDTAPVKFVRGMLIHKPPHFDRWGRNNGKVVVDLESLDEVSDNDLLELTASLMTYPCARPGSFVTRTPHRARRRTWLMLDWRARSFAYIAYA